MSLKSLKASAKKLLPLSVVDFFRRFSGKGGWQHWIKYHAKHRNHAQNEFSDRYDFLRKSLIALKFNGIAGDYVEFGCCGAMTFCIAHRLLTDYSYNLGSFHLWAFDSFQGLPGSAGAPDVHPRWKPGTLCTPVEDFHALCKSRGVPQSAYTAVPGFYDQSLDPSATGPRPDKIRLAYIDCDMFSSTETVLKFLMPRLQHGMILAFDDYYCYSNTLPSGERLALAAAFAKSPQWRLLPYLPFGWHGMSFIVEAADPETLAIFRNIDYTSATLITTP